MLTHRVDGEGPPLVLLNGGLMTIGAWESYVAALGGEYRIIRCDFRGQLLTPGPYPVSLDEHAGDVLELLDYLDVESAHVAGTSFGGEVAMALAARASQRVSRLTVITATDHFDERMRGDAREGRRLAVKAAAGDRDSAARMFQRIFEDTWSEAWLEQQPDFIESRISRMAMLPPVYFEGAAAIFAVLDSIDLRPVLGRITAETLVIGAEHDRVFPPEHSRAIAEAIPGARVEIIHGAGHGLVVEQAELVIARLRR